MLTMWGTPPRRRGTMAADATPGCRLPPPQYIPRRADRFHPHLGGGRGVCARHGVCRHDRTCHLVVCLATLLTRHMNADLALPLPNSGELVNGGGEVPRLLPAP